jgi:subtilisin family serine protease
MTIIPFFRRGILIALGSSASLLAGQTPDAPLRVEPRLASQGYRETGTVINGQALVAAASPQARLVDAPGRRPLLAYRLRDGEPGADWLLVHSNDLIVTLASKADLSVVQTRAARADSAIEIVDSVPGATILLVRAKTTEVLTPERVLELFKKATGVEPQSVEPNQVLTLEDAQDGLYERHLQPWAHRNRGDSGFKLDADIDGNEAIARLIRSASTAPILRETLIMVIDTGADLNHPALREALWVNSAETPGNNLDDDGNGYRDDINGWNFADGHRLIFDSDGHGTHVAGIIAGRPDRASGAIRGAAIGARLIIGKVDVTADTGMLQVVKAIYYAIDKNASLANMSFSFRSISPAFEKALSDFDGAGGIAVASAGNARNGQPPLNVQQTPHYPCMSPFVVCVAASDQQDKRAIFSNYGASFSPQGKPGVALAAPGVDILSAAPGGGYVSLSGTSMATPIVTAAFAAAWKVRPLATSKQIRTQVIFTSDRATGLSVDDVEDQRRLNLYRALFGRPDEDYSIGYCDERLTDPQTGQTFSRSQNYPFANSGDPGVDGASVAGAFAICTTAQMINIQDEMLDRIFVLKRDLNWKLDPSGGWSYAVGQKESAAAKPFNGVLDGGGYAIVGFDQGLRANAGLVAWLGPRGHVLNMRFRDVRLRGVQTAGTVAARNDGGRIFNVQAEGTVEAPAAGGLVGGMTGGEIRFSSFEGRVSGTARVGGLAAQLAGPTSSIADSIFSGEVAARFETGGLVGHMSHQARILRSHANVDMRSAPGARQLAGGLVGHMTCRARIIDSFAEGSIVASAMAGGLIGRMTNADIQRGFASVSFSTKNGTIGGTVGEIKDGITGDTGNYQCSESPAKPAPSSRTDDFFDGELGQPGNGIALSAVQIRTPATYSGWSRDTWTFRSAELPSLTRLPRSSHPDY